MRRTSHTTIVSLVCGLAGIALGFGLACSAVRVEVLVDYDSGATLRLIRIGPVVVRKEQPFSSGLSTGQVFAMTPTPAGRTALTGNRKWHRALLFVLNSNVSPSYEGGTVLNLIRRLEVAAQIGRTNEMSSMKEAFLRALSERGTDAAALVVEQAENKMRAGK